MGRGPAVTQPPGLAGVRPGPTPSPHPRGGPLGAPSTLSKGVGRARLRPLSPGSWSGPVPTVPSLGSPPHTLGAGHAPQPPRLAPEAGEGSASFQPWASGRAPPDGHTALPRGDHRQPPLRGEVASGSGGPSVRPPLCSQRCSGLGPGHPQAPGVPTWTQGHRREEDGAPAGGGAEPSAREKRLGNVLVILPRCHRARGARGSGGEARER